MLDGMTALGFMAAHSEKARIGLMVGGIHYRAPGLWIKAHTTLDVLTGGRAWFGIGAAWNEEESAAPGLPHAPAGERFEWLEDTLQMAVRHVERRVGQRRAIRGQAGHRHPPAELAAGDQPPARADHDRRWRRAEDAAPGGRSTPMPATSSAARSGSRTSTRSCASTASGWAAPTTRSNARTLQGVDLDRESPDEVVDRFGALGGGRLPARHLQPARRGRHQQAGAPGRRGLPAAALRSDSGQSSGIARCRRRRPAPPGTPACRPPPTTPSGHRPVAQPGPMDRRH